MRILQGIWRRPGRTCLSWDDGALQNDLREGKVSWGACSSTGRPGKKAHACMSSCLHPREEEGSGQGEQAYQFREIGKGDFDWCKSVCRPRKA